MIYFFFQEMTINKRMVYLYIKKLKILLSKKYESRISHDMKSTGYFSQKHTHLFKKNSSNLYRGLGKLNKTEKKPSNTFFYSRVSRYTVKIFKPIYSI